MFTGTLDRNISAESFPFFQKIFCKIALKKIHYFLAAVNFSREINPLNAKRHPYMLLFFISSSAEINLNHELACGCEQRTVRPCSAKTLNRLVVAVLTNISISRFDAAIRVKRNLICFQTWTSNDRQVTAADWSRWEVELLRKVPVRKRKVTP